MHLCVWWKYAATSASLVLLSGCITPGFRDVEPPGFSSTYYHTEMYRRGMWTPERGMETSTFIAPVSYLPEPVRQADATKRDGIVPGRSVKQPPVIPGIPPTPTSANAVRS